MEELPVPKGTDDLVAEVIVALNQMRDSLVKTSMLLQDYRFEIDTAGRQAAGDEAREVLERNRTPS